jgi:hypothetical protein
MADRPCPTRVEVDELLAFLSAFDGDAVLGVEDRVRDHASVEVDNSRCG